LKQRDFEFLFFLINSSKKIKDNLFLPVFINNCLLIINDSYKLFINNWKSLPLLIVCNFQNIFQGNLKLHWGCTIINVLYILLPGIILAAHINGNGGIPITIVPNPTIPCWGSSHWWISFLEFCVTKISIFSEPKFPFWNSCNVTWHRCFNSDKFWPALRMRFGRQV
jgi:hypothetical protein